MALRHHLGVIGATLLAGRGGVAVAQGGERAPKAQGKPYSLTIAANIPAATVMEDGFFLGNVGNSFDTAAGEHIFLIAAPGFVPRLIHVKLAGNQLTSSVTVGLLPVPEKNTSIELEFERAKGFRTAAVLDSLPSLCKQYRATQAAISAAVLLPCSRATVLDDLKGQAYAPLALPAAAGKLGELIAALPNAATDDYFWAAEAAYRETPGVPAAATLLAFGAIMRHDCVRVMEVAMEVGAARVTSPGLGFVRGLCLELAGGPAKAAALYQSLAGAEPATLAALAYHAARATARQGPPGPADALLERCKKALPSYYPCFETQAHLLALRGRTDAGRAVLADYWNATAKAVVAAIPRSAPALDPERIAKAQDLRPWSFELTAARLVTTTDPDLAGRLEALILYTRITDLDTVRRLLPRFEAVRKGKLVVIALESLLARAPKDTTLLIKLAAAYREQSRCPEALTAWTQALRWISDPERRAALIITMTTCQLAVDHLDEAERQLTGVLKDYPENWHAAYNLGVVQERLGKSAEAMENYRQAMLGDVPPQIAARLTQTLSHYDRLGKKAPAAGADVGH